MNVEVFLTSSNVEDEDVRGRTVIVIDVLRACSTIATALDNGARAVVPVPDMAQASRIAQNLDPDVYLLGGERGGKKIEGYHLGNSPTEYGKERVAGRDVILNTTNGTMALTRARGAAHLVAGSFLNAGRVVEAIRAFGNDATILCAGQDHRISLEDTFCAGLMLYLLWGGEEPDAVSDTAHLAFTQYLCYRDNVASVLHRCENARRLARLGLADDIDYCLQVDALPVLPYYRDNRLVLHEDVAHSPLSVQ